MTNLKSKSKIRDRERFIDIGNFFRLRRIKQRDILEKIHFSKLGCKLTVIREIFAFFCYKLAPKSILFV